ncbi:hypothetical protein L2E82_29911 [Cichorium intybus]|uniref:Uncharacterized protein n=1 Tax=Cichorium intybus TaxID=13427 RepID=A0ACB9CYW8_CICIN|nr:hypothetical protein L2E82_29911 [Cichorium intybus]
MPPKDETGVFTGVGVKLVNNGATVGWGGWKKEVGEGLNIGGPVEGWNGFLVATVLLVMFLLVLGPMVALSVWGFWVVIVAGLSFSRHYRRLEWWFLVACHNTDGANDAISAPCPAAYHFTGNSDRLERDLRSQSQGNGNVSRSPGGGPGKTLRCLS